MIVNVKENYFYPRFEQIGRRDAVVNRKRLRESPLNELGELGESTANQALMRKMNIVSLPSTSQQKGYFSTNCR